MKSTRRGFLKGVGGLAASLASLVAMKPESLLKLPEPAPEERQVEMTFSSVHDPSEPLPTHINATYVMGKSDGPPSPYLSMGFMCPDCEYRTYATHPDDDKCPKCGTLEEWRI